MLSLGFLYRKHFLILGADTKEWEYSNKGLMKGSIRSRKPGCANMFPLGMGSEKKWPQKVAWYRAGSNTGRLKVRKWESKNHLLDSL